MYSLCMYSYEYCMYCMQPENNRRTSEEWVERFALRQCNGVKFGERGEELHSGAERLRFLVVIPGSPEIIIQQYGIVLY